MHKKLSVAFGAMLAALVPATSTMAFAKPKPLDKGATTKRPKGPKGPTNPPKNNGTTLAEAGTHQGVIGEMVIRQDGTIGEILLKISGRTYNRRIKGCGAQSQAHPLLNWAFTEQRLVYITTDASSCMSNVLISR